MKEARHKKQSIMWFHLYGIFRIGKFMETESRLVVARGLEEGEMRSGY